MDTMPGSLGAGAGRAVGRQQAQELLLGAGEGDAAATLSYPLPSPPPAFSPCPPLPVPVPGLPQTWIRVPPLRTPGAPLRPPRLRTRHLPLPTQWHPARRGPLWGLLSGPLDRRLQLNLGPLPAWASARSPCPLGPGDLSRGHGPAGGPLVLWEAELAYALSSRAQGLHPTPARSWGSGPVAHTQAWPRPGTNEDSRGPAPQPAPGSLSGGQQGRGRTGFSEGQG